MCFQKKSTYITNKTGISQVKTLITNKENFLMKDIFKKKGKNPFIV